MMIFKWAGAVDTGMNNRAIDQHVWRGFYKCILWTVEENFLVCDLVIDHMIKRIL